MAAHSIICLLMVLIIVHSIGLFTCMGKIRPSFTTLVKMSGSALTISVVYFLQVFIKNSEASRFPA